VGSITKSSPTRRPEDYRFETAWWISSYPAPNGALVTPAGTFSWAGQDRWGWDILLDGQPVGPPANQIYLDGNGEVWVLANTIWFKYPDFQNPAAPNPPPPACPPPPPPPPPPAPPAGSTLAVNGSTTPAPIVAGDQFWVAIRNDPGNSLDFVGFCDASQPDNGTYYSKTNVGGVANADLVITTTDLTQAPVPAGNYEVRLIVNDTTPAAARVPITISAYIEPPFPALNGVNDICGLYFSCKPALASSAQAIAVAKTVTIATSLVNNVGDLPQNVTVHFTLSGAPIGSPVFSAAGTPSLTFDTTTMPNGVRLLENSGSDSVDG